MDQAWEPMTLQCCVGSDLLGWLTAGLACGMLFWYSAIASRWWEAANYSSPEGKNVWRWLVAIFIVCAVAGYGSLIMALWFPKTAVMVRIVFLSIQNICCPAFWHYASKRRFETLGRREAMGAKLGDDLTGVVSTTEVLSDRELASLARNMVVKSLERHADE